MLEAITLALLLLSVALLDIQKRNITVWFYGSLSAMALRISCIA